MRLTIAAVALLGLSSPALATGGFECRPTTGSGPVVTIGIGHGLSLRPFAVTLRDGRQLLSTGEPGRGSLTLGQSWIDHRHLWLDLVDPQGNRFEAQLRATFQPKTRGRPAIGTLLRKGRTWRVRCIEA